MTTSGTHGVLSVWPLSHPYYYILLPLAPMAGSTLVWTLCHAFWFICSSLPFYRCQPVLSLYLHISTLLILGDALLLGNLPQLALWLPEYLFFLVLFVYFLRGGCHACSIFHSLFSLLSLKMKIQCFNSLHILISYRNECSVWALKLNVDGAGTGRKRQGWILNTVCAGTT